MDTVLIAGFPGVGKSYFCTRKPHDYDNDYLDLQDKLFKYLKEIETSSDIKEALHPSWPLNYLHYVNSSIHHQASKKRYVFISTGARIIDDILCFKQELHYIKIFLVYPSLEIREEYINRFKYFPEYYKTALNDKYDSWVNRLSQLEGCEHIVLKKGQYLADFMPKIANKIKIKQ